MRTPTKVLIAGAVLAGLVAAGGAANTARLEGWVKQLEAACVAESTPTFKLVCEADELVRLEHDSKSKGIQLQIVTAHRSLHDSKEWPYLLALLILVVGVAPWAWYFFLRRVAELRDAIVGKRDA